MPLTLSLIPRLQKFDYHLFYLSCWSSAPKPHKEWPSHSGTHHVAQRRFFVLASSHCSSLKTEPVYFLASGKHLLHVEVNWVTPGQVNDWICYSDLLLISNCATCLCTGFLQSLTSKEVADGGTGTTVCTPLLTHVIAIADPLVDMMKQGPSDVQCQPSLLIKAIVGPGLRLCPHVIFAHRHLK